MAITYTELSRRPVREGVDIAAQFTDDETGDVHTVTFYFDTPSPAALAVTARMDKKAKRLLFRANPLNSFEIEGDEVRPVIRALAIYVRANPTATQADAAGLINTNFPNLIWKTVPLFKMIMRHVRAVSWGAFKLILIGKKFEDVD